MQRYAISRPMIDAMHQTSNVLEQKLGVPTGGYLIRQLGMDLEAASRGSAPPPLDDALSAVPLLRSLAELLDHHGGHDECAGALEHFADGLEYWVTCLTARTPASRRQP